MCGDLFKINFLYQKNVSLFRELHLFNSLAHDLNPESSIAIVWPVKAESQENRFLKKNARKEWLDLALFSMSGAGIYPKGAVKFAP